MLIADFNTEQSEVLIGLLSVFPFEGFQEFEKSVQAYIEEEEWNRIQQEVRQTISGLATFVKIEALPEKNWNAEWESSFQPVLIDDFCAIRASFHQPITVCDYEIVIDPRMAFGTGHHETTELMIRQMRNLDFNNKSVLDLGCGTGILAILAAKLGAAQIVAVDNDPEAVSNVKENAAINAAQITCVHGTVYDLPSQTYDIVLANINRNVLIDVMPDMKRVLKKEGHLLLSGILTEDKKLIVEAAESEYLHVVKEQALGEWLSLWLMNYK